ncbi:hypothetical protein ACLKA7_015032 [Drosophila subpalustris]
MTRRQIIEAVQRDDNTDPRVFADVEITGRKMKGLLDTGASVSLLGRGCRELVEELEWPVQPYASMVRTAAGASRPILGRVVLPVKYKDRVESIVFYMCPDLQQELYLGIDFWRAFEIAPDVLGAPTIHEADPDVAEATVANTDVSYYRDEDDVVSDPEMWNLEERQYLRLVAECLRKANLTIGMAKSKFCFRTLNYLGYIIGGGTLRMDPGRVEAIKNIPTPRNVKELRSFLGTAGWYRRFIKNFAEISVPLTDALKKKAGKFQLSEEAVEAVEKLKSALTTAPVLVHADFKKPFFIQCDASHFGVGAVLFQLDDEQQERPIAFFSAKLNKHQINYTVTEKECLAAKLAIHRFRPYVEMMPFTVITDHASLQWLMSLKDLSGRLARWSLELQAFPFSMRYKKGADNVVADTLSRSVEEVEITPEDLLGFQTLEFESPAYQELVQEVTSQEQRLPDLKVQNGMLFKRMSNVALEDEVEGTSWKLWIPESLTAGLIQKAHTEETAAHGGMEKTLHALRRQYYWPGMVIQVRDFVRKCEVCKETKAQNYRTQVGIGREVLTDRPFQKIYVDFLGKYPRSKRGHAWIFIVVDHFSKFTFLKAMKEASAADVVNFLVHEVFFKFGVPEVIHSDNGRQFISKSFEAMIKAFGITHLRTPVYSPQSNAAERVNRSVLSAIRTYLEQDHREWDAYLPEVEVSIRNAVHTATGVTPFFAVFGQHMYLNGASYKLARKLRSLSDHDISDLDAKDRLDVIRGQVKQHLHAAYERSRQRYDQRARQFHLVPGQEVWRRNFALSNFGKAFNAKFARKFLKSRVVRAVGDNAYELEDLQGRALGVFHAKDLRS